MDRREFLRLGAAAGAAAAMTTGGAARSAPAGEAKEDPKAPAERMKVGCQRWGSNPKRLPHLLRCGVRNICASPARAGPDGVWTEETCRDVRKAVEEAGLQADMMYWGVPIQVLVPGQRDALIERACKNILAAGKAGIPGLQYTLNVRVWQARTGRASGRGGGTYSEWDLSKVDSQRKPHVGSLTAEEHWDRITYFLNKVVPVATEAKVRLALHPNDPPMPDKNRWNIDQVLDSVDGLKKFVQIAESPYHGVLFCQGCVWEMLPKSAKPDGLYEAIRWFGRRKKIFAVHFRNLRGGAEKFVETFHDEGEIDMFKAAMTYKEVGYTGMLMPDHVPHHPDDPEGLQHFAFAYGYIKGLVQAAYSV